MGSGPSMAVCVLLVVAMWFSTIEGNCRRHCSDRCDEAHKNRKLQSTIGSCYRKCSKLAETCEFCAGPRRCLTCKRNYARTSNSQCVFNECTLNNGGCSVDAKCLKKPKEGGSFDFYCACNSGFTGNGTSCTDINECLTNNGGCDANAICNNTRGSYWCACRRGMTGDGKKCIGNLALNRPAIQSTTKDGANASLAVDGSLLTVAGSVALQTYYNWWAVDLGEPSVISAIVFYAESDAAGASTLTYINVGKSNTSPTVGQAYASSSYTLCQLSQYGLIAAGFAVVGCPKDASTYRYVIFQAARNDYASLRIAEAEVYYVIPSDHMLGCYTARYPVSFTSPQWSESQLTIEKCIAVCYSLGFKYAGAFQSASCACMTTYGQFGMSSLCTLPCNGDATQICGGQSGAFSLYTTGVV